VNEKFQWHYRESHPQPPGFYRSNKILHMPEYTKVFLLEAAAQKKGLPINKVLRRFLTR